MRYIIIISIILIIAVSSCSVKPKAKSKPNIVIINIDDMGWKDVGFMGSDYYETPNIDSLSAAGMIFTNGYAASANSAPSRACLMTGLWTPRHGIYTVGSSERGNSNNPLLIRFGQFITQTSRRKGIEMIKEKGEREFLEFMSERNWVTIKNKGK